MAFWCEIVLKKKGQNMKDVQKAITDKVNAEHSRHLSDIDDLIINNVDPCYYIGQHIPYHGTVTSVIKKDGEIYVAFNRNKQHTHIDSLAN